jgi:hypothetical protein
MKPADPRLLTVMGITCAVLACSRNEHEKPAASQSLESSVIPAGSNEVVALESAGNPRSESAECPRSTLDTRKPFEAPKPALRLHVSPTGSDDNDGRTETMAFQSIVRARDEVRALKAARELPAGGVVVEIAPGDYALTESLQFGPQDSGRAGAPVFYCASGKGNVVIHGSRVLKSADLAPVTEPQLLRRIDPAVRGKVLGASIDALGLKHAGPFPGKFDDSGGIFELFWNGRRLPLSRWPNDGWTTMKRIVVNGDNKIPGTFEYRDDRPRRWILNRQLWLKGQWRVPWEEPAVRVAKIDADARTITFAQPIAQGIGNKYTRPDGNGKEPWCAINLPEEIDLPGEWCIDFETRTLLLLPPEGKWDLRVTQLEKPLVNLNGAAHLKFIGLTFDASLGHGVVMEKSESNEIAGCSFRNLAKFGAIIDGYRSGVRSSDMYDLGEGCILISGGDSKQLIPSENYVLNNHLHHYGVRKAMYSAAVDVGYGGAPNYDKHRPAVGIHVAHNLIHDGPRDSILVSGQNNLFEKNEIFRCGFASDDLGAFYSWFDWTIRGVVIRHNYIHNTVGGVNPDDGASGSLIHGNIFAGPRTGVWIASGPDHTISNNIFIKAEGPVLGIDDRGESRGYGANPRLIKPVQALQPDKEPWSKQFPEMATLLASRPELPLRNRFLNNLVVIQKGEPVLLKMKAGNKTNPDLFSESGNYVTKTDPGFVDIANGDLTLRPDAEVFTKIPGFEPIPFEQIGLYKDACRTEIPSGEAIGRPRNNPMFEQNPNKHFGTL